MQFLPDAKFIIGLVDQFDSSIDYSNIKDFEVLPCLDLGYQEFKSMLDKYDIVEFNTAVKPFYFEYLFQNYPSTNQIFYLDPDIVFYHSPLVLENEFGRNEVLLTPNLIYTSNKPSSGEFASLRHGMYNLGFIGMRRGKESFRLIQWWKERLKEHCRIDKCQGIFVDQKWMDLAPIFFEKIIPVKNPGWNMAWWNFSERKLLAIKKGYFVNEITYPLIFFHFSGFKPGLKKITERIFSEIINPESEQILTGLFEAYEDKLVKNGYHSFKNKRPLLKFNNESNLSKINLKGRLKSKLKRFVKKFYSEGR